MFGLSQAAIFLFNTPSLTVLDLSHNQIAGTIQESSLDLNKNMSIDLSGNQIERIDYQPSQYDLRRIPGLHNTNIVSYQVTVSLSSNMMICDCFTSEVKNIQISDKVTNGVLYQDFMWL